MKEKAKRRKGRGHGAELVSTRDDVGHYESMNVVEEDDNEPGPQRCKRISVMSYLILINVINIIALVVKLYHYFCYIFSC